MIIPELPKNEEERLESLLSHEFEAVYNSDEFNFLTDLAAQVSGCEVSLISLIYKDKQWFLSHHGLAVSETPRDYAFCAHAIMNPTEVFTIENALDDERFRENPLVVGEPHIRFYSGIPIIDKTGLPLGTLCVIDSAPKQLNQNQRASLKRIAVKVQKLFDLQKFRVEERKRLYEAEMNAALFADAQELNGSGAWSFNLTKQEVYWTPMVYKIHEVDNSFFPNIENGLSFYHEEDRQQLEKALSLCIEKGTEFCLQSRFITAKGTKLWVRSTGKNKGDHIVGSFQDITIIKQNEMKLKSIINASSSLLVILDKSGCITELNDSCTDLVQMQREDFVGKPFWECNYWSIEKEVIDELHQKFQKALQGIETSEELVLWINGQIPFTVHFIVRPVIDELGAIAFVMAEAIPIQDIVDERNLNKFILEGANVASGYWNCVNNDIHLDERWYQIIGYSSDELYPMTPEKFMSFYHPDDLAKCSKILIRVLSGELEYYDVEARLKHKQGHWIWIHDQGRVLHRSQEGQPISMYGIHQEITQRKQREIKLAYQESLLNTLFASSPVGITLSDYQNLRYIDANQSFLDLLGYEKAELMQMTFKDITPNADLNRENQIRSSLESSGLFMPYQKVYLKKDGTQVPVIIQGMLVKDTMGKELVWTFIQDISKEKQAENESRLLLELTQEQNERLYNFARIVSHNLKNHSDGIIGILELLREQNPELGNNKFLNLFEKSAKNLVQTIQVLTEEKLLNSKLGNLPLEFVNISELIEKNTLSVRGDLIRSAYKIENLVDSELEIRGVHAYLDSIVLNLITNAIKYRNPNVAGVLKIWNDFREGYIVLNFQDNGLGIDLEQYGNELFGLHKTFHGNTDSRGIGLYISKNQIEQMGGKIEVESKVDEGTIFRVFLCRN